MSEQDVSNQPLEISQKFMDIFVNRPPDQKGPPAIVEWVQFKRAITDKPVSMKINFTTVEHANFLKAFAQERSLQGIPTEISIIASEEQHRMAANAFESGINWIDSAKD